MNPGMAKRELSSTLKNLKFMQRAAPREEKANEEKEKPDPDGIFFSAATPGSVAATARRRCIVIVEGDPHPGALRGRMSFQSFNPSIDKLNEETATIHQMQASSMSNENDNISDRLQEKLVVRSEEPKCSSQDDNLDADLKRKQAVVEMEIAVPDKSQKTGTGSLNGKSSPQNPSSSNKKQKQEKLNWNLLKPPKAWKKRT